jgi:hypothetical protein
MLYNKTEERTVADGYALVEADLKKKPLTWTFWRFFFFVLLTLTGVIRENGICKGQHGEDHNRVVDQNFRRNKLLHHNTDPLLRAQRI